MRIVSFNIHHGTVGRKGPVDPEQLGEVCASFEADVLCLQEVDQGTIRVKGRDLAAVAAEAAGMAYVFGTSQRLLGGRYGNAVLARGTLGQSELTRLPKVPRHRVWQEQRTLLEVPVELADGPLWVACTHLAVKRWNNGPQLEVVRLFGVWVTLNAKYTGLGNSIACVQAFVRLAPPSPLTPFVGLVPEPDTATALESSRYTVPVPCRNSPMKRSVH